MKKVYTHENRLLVFNAKNLLEGNDIGCMIKNEFAGGGVGELAPFESWPELWVVADEDEERAERLLSSLGRNTAEDKFCPHCGELNAANFQICWRCGQSLNAVV